MGRKIQVVSGVNVRRGETPTIGQHSKPSVAPVKTTIKPVTKNNDLAN